MLDVIRYEREENPIRLDFAPTKSESDITNVHNRRGAMMSSHYLEVCRFILSDYLLKKKFHLDSSKKSASSRTND
jgi:hypothetical protein